MSKQPKHIICTSFSFIKKNLSKLIKQHSIYEHINNLDNKEPQFIYLLCDVDYNLAKIQNINPHGFICIYTNRNEIECNHMILTKNSLLHTFWIKICIQLLCQFTDQSKIIVLNPKAPVKLLTENFGFKNESNRLVKYPKAITNHIEDYRKYIFQKGTTCFSSGTFSKTSILFLQNILYNYYINNNGKIVQNEFAGLLYLSNHHSKQSYIVDVDFMNMTRGKKDDVDYPNGLFNYHIHPINAYLIHNTRKGWPSNSDYLVFLQNFIYPPMGQPKTYFTCVSAVEGMYVITLSPQFVKDVKESDNIKELYRHYKSIIEKKYNISKTDTTKNLRFQNIQMYRDYTKHINSVENGCFKLYYSPWKSLSSFTFKFFFPSTVGGKCIL